MCFGLNILQYLCAPVGPWILRQISDPSTIYRISLMDNRARLGAHSIRDFVQEHCPATLIMELISDDRKHVPLSWTDDDR